MEMTEVVKVLLEQIKETVRSETVVGKPVQAEDSVIIPVSRVSFGFGVGGGNSVMEGKDSGGGMGSGGGASIEPVAFVVVSKGKAQILPLKSREATLTRLIDLVPQFMDLCMSCKGDKEAKKDAGDEEKTGEKHGETDTD